MGECADGPVDRQRETVEHDGMPQLPVDIARRIDAAQGRRTADLCLTNTRYLDVFSGVFREGALTIDNGVVVAIDAPHAAHRTIDLGGRAVVPGFIDAHVHIESSLLVPHRFAETVLRRGTTAAICDPHELANVLGVDGLRYFLEAAEAAPMDLHIMLSSCVPATHFETNGGGTLGAAELAPLRRHRQALGLAEVMNVPAVLGNDPEMLAKLQAFDGTPRDGHCPLLRGDALSAYAAARITSCHESSEAAEAQEKLTKGLAVWIREGSVAKDLTALAPLLTMASSMSMGFCTDDRNPLDIHEEGHLDHLLRRAIAQGVAPEVAYRAASFSVAHHYGLAGASVLTPVGAVAPGYRADLVVLDDVATCAVSRVLSFGRFADELDYQAHANVPEAARTSVRATAPAANDLQGPPGQVHVIGVRAGRILTDRSVEPHDTPGIMRLSVLERYGHGLAPANAYVRGFGALRGAIASSVGHDSHNLICVGAHTEDMRAAFAALIESGGGFVVVSERSVIAKLALPVGGLMTQASPNDIASALRELRQASRAIGCELPEPFLQLAFLSLPVIPTLKLTDRGLVDVDRFELIGVRAA
jgi:adenine deaminase